MAYSILTYLIEATVCISVFYLLYRLLLSRLTHFQWNRFYLISIVLLSALIPILDIPITFNPVHEESALHEVVVAADNIETELLAPLNTTEQTALEPVTSAVDNSISLSISEVILLLYLLGFCYFAARFLQNIWVMILMIRNNEGTKQNNYYLIENRLGLPTFSFFKYVFLETRNEELSDSEIQQILRHEAVHIEQYHSVDILLFNLYRVIFWFNPLSRYLKESIREAHEFIADRSTVSSTNDKEREEYSRLIVKLSAQRNSISMSSNFSKMEVKKRIQMLVKLRSANAQKLKFILILPLLAVMLTAFSLSKQLNGQMDKYTIYNSVGEVKHYFIREYDEQGDIIKSSWHHRDGELLYFTEFLYYDGLLIKEQVYHGDKVTSGRLAGKPTGDYVKYTYDDTLMTSWGVFTQAGTKFGGGIREYDDNNFILRDLRDGREVEGNRFRHYETDSQGRILKVQTYDFRNVLTFTVQFEYLGEELSKKTRYRGDGALFETHTVEPL